MEFETILHILKYNAENFGNNTAVIEGRNGKSIAYEELWKRIVNFAGLLKVNEFQKGQRAIIRVTQTIECLVAVYGIQLAGGTAIPVEAGTSEDRILYLLDYFEASVLISTQSVYYDCKFYNLRDVLAAPDAAGHPALPRADDLALIVYTTGTTGKSKGVMLTFKNRLTGADNQAAEITVTPNDVGLITQPLSHSGGLRRCDVLFIYGGRVVLLDGVGLPYVFFSVLEKYNVSVIWFVPAQLSLLLSCDEEGQFSSFDGKLRVVIFESAKPLESQKEELRKLLPNVRLYVNYSSTEATGTCHFEYSAFPVMQDCVGKGITPHSRVLFVDEQGREVTATKDNQAIIASEGGSVALGYWKEPELSAKTFINGRLISADVGYKDENGFIYVTGRRDDVIVSGGNKISPHEVEEAAMEINGIKECACVPIPDKLLGYVPKLYIVLEESAEVLIDDVYKALSNKLEPFKVPKAVEAIAELPRVGVGKISRRALIAMSESQ